MNEFVCLWERRLPIHPIHINECQYGVVLSCHSIPSPEFGKWVHSRACDRKFWKTFGSEHVNTWSRWGSAVEFMMDFNQIRVVLLSFNSSVRAELPFTIRYPNIVIKSPCGNLDICLNYTNAYFRPQDSVRVLSVADRNWQWKMLFQITPLGRTLEQFLDFGREKAEHVNAPNVSKRSPV